MALFGELSYCVSHQTTCCLRQKIDKRKKMVPQNPMLVFCSHLVVSIEHYLFDEIETRSFSLSFSFLIYSCNQLFHHQLSLFLFSEVQPSIEYSEESESEREGRLLLSVRPLRAPEINVV